MAAEFRGRWCVAFGTEANKSPRNRIQHQGQHMVNGAWQQKRKKKTEIKRYFYSLRRSAESQILLQEADTWHTKSIKHACKHSHQHLPPAISIHIAVF